MISRRRFFIKDAEGAPLRSDRVTFGGWRRGPWFARDGTRPGTQRTITFGRPRPASVMDDWTDAPLGPGRVR
jgi:hypothetical protein